MHAFAWRHGSQRGAHVVRLALAYLHAQATPRWRGKRAAMLAVLGYLAFLFNFFGVNLWIPGLHSYAGI